MRPTMAARAVRVPPPVIRGQQIAERGEQVVVGPAAGLEDRDAGRRMRHEDVQQPVSARLACEPAALAADVADNLARSGLDLERLRLHPRHLTVVRASRGITRLRILTSRRSGVRLDLWHRDATATR